MKPQTMIFGLDGATYTVLDDLMARGIMPNLKRFIETGAKGKMLSITPPLTPPAWTTLATGRTPGNHGVFGFFQYDSLDNKSIQLISSRNVIADTMWHMVNKQGKRAGVLNYVAHQPAPKIDGWVLPGWVSWRWLKRLSHPADLIDRLKGALPNFDVKTLAIDFEEERKAVAGSPIDDNAGWVDLHIRREKQWNEVMWHMMETDPVDLAAVVYDGVDKLQHGIWDVLDPRLEPKDPTPEFLRKREMAWGYFKTIDNILGQTMEKMGDEGTILICSDHGFTDSYELLFINTWLEEQGFLTWRPDYDPPADSEDINPTFYQHGAFDFAKTKAYAITTSSNGIYIPVKRKEGEEGIDPADYEKVRNELIEALMTKCVDPETGEKLVTRVWTREEIFSGPHMDVSPDLTLSLRDCGFFSVRRATKTYMKRSMVLGTHHPEGILIARGPGIKHGAEFEPVQLIDVAPTALYSMGLEIPEDLQGRLLTEIYDADYMANRPAKWSSSLKTAEEVPVSVPETSEEDDEIMEKLRALGYLE